MMTQTPKKVAVIGLDCALPHLIEKHIAEGYLPNFGRLIREGVIAENCLVPFPTITPPGWASIATGAWPGTHGITDFHVPIPGATPNTANVVQAFNSERWLAEPVWDALDRAGKKCIVLNYPGAWPSHLKNGIMVGGQGLSVGQKRDGNKLHIADISLCHDQMIATGLYPHAIQGKFQPAAGWQDAGDLGADPLEMVARMQFPGARPKPPTTYWHVLARQSHGQGYDRVTLSPAKNGADAFCTLAVGEWSPKIFTTITMADGTAKEVFFRCKLMELSHDAEEFRLFVGGLCETSGWSTPPEVAAELTSEGGTFGFGGGMIGYAYGWFDYDTVVEINDHYTAWLADAAVSLLGKHEWDAFFMHSHPPDWIYHVLITDLEPATCPDAAKRERAWRAHRHVYEAQDRLIGRILEVVGSDAVVALVSDHGATPDGPIFDPYKALVPAGLTVLTEQQPDIEELIGTRPVKVLMPDPFRSQAFPQRSCYVYVNLKGRDPEGLVDPADYEAVQQRIVDALLTYVDPETGRRPVALALTKKDARLLGLYGDRIGDVVYAVYPWFDSQHGPQLPTGEWGVGSLKGLLVLTGPGLKQGHRLGRTCGIVDLVPTICYLTGWPVPAQCEGAVVYQALENPNR